MEEPKVKQAEKTTGGKVFSVVIIIFCVLLIPIIVINTIMIVSDYKHPDEVADLGGYYPVVAISNNVGLDIAEGDLLICQKTAPENINNGDSLSFYASQGQNDRVMVQQVTEITTQEDGKLYFTVQANDSFENEDDLVNEELVIGKCLTKLSGIGYVVLYLQSIPGMITCVAIALLVYLAGLLLTKNQRKEKVTETV